ncbi:MAG: FtsB family cell division protein [Alphaproteobacteria bacterium]
MNKIASQNFFAKDSFLTLLGVLLCLYFSYHAISGERSLFKLVSLNQEISQNVTIKDNVAKMRQNTESKVLAMRPGSINSDLLEERARLILGYARPDEMVILSN